MRSPKRTTSLKPKLTLGTAPGGYLLLAAGGCPTLRIPVDSADMASAQFAAYRERYCLAASDLGPGCGDIRGNDGRVVAWVSYNARVWTPDGHSSKNVRRSTQKFLRAHRTRTAHRSEQGLYSRWTIALLCALFCCAKAQGLSLKGRTLRYEVSWIVTTARRGKRDRRPLAPAAIRARDGPSQQ